MPLAVLIAAAAAAAAQPEAQRSTPIIVKGHVWAAFISPMGEPFRPRGAGDDTLARWFNQADRNQDGMLTADEMLTDADRFFATLDTDNNGEIDPDELAHYEWEVAPDVQVNSRTRRSPGQPSPTQSKDTGDTQSRRHERDRQRAAEVDALGIGGALQGAARYSLLNIPEPVAAADTDFNRAISLQEFRQAALARFQLLDRERQGRLTLAGLKALLPELPAPGAKRKRRKDAADSRIGNPLPPGN